MVGRNLFESRVFGFAIVGRVDANRTAAAIVFDLVRIEPFGHVAERPFVQLYV